jgi:hypothetical protein
MGIGNGSSGSGPDDPMAGIASFFPLAISAVGGFEQANWWCGLR